MTSGFKGKAASRPHIRLACMLSAVFVLCVIFQSAAQQDEYRPLDDSEIFDSLAAADTTGYAPALHDSSEYVQSKKGTQKLKLVRRGYNYREQLGLAMGMMAFVAVIILTSQNWNPD
jgi:hypothetical protein